MLSFFKAYKKFAIAFLIISIVIISIIYSKLNVYQPLPIYQPAMVSTDLGDSTLQYQKDYKNKIYVADFFFTTCQSICPIMTNHMAIIQKEIMDDTDVMLLSFSVTPQIDSVAQLKRYAIEKGVNDKKWNLLTGDKKQIYELARKSYLAVKTTGNGDEFDMIHTENFMLIDKKKQIRGFYDGTNPKDIDQLLDDIKILKKEYTK